MGFCALLVAAQCKGMSLYLTFRDDLGDICQSAIFTHDWNSEGCDIIQGMKNKSFKQPSVSYSYI